MSEDKGTKRLECAVCGTPLSKAQEPCPRCGSSRVFQSTADKDLKSTNPTYDPLLNQKLGPYQLVEFIARGGMGRIYKAYHPGLSKYVAIKTISPDAISQEFDAIERFLQEAQLTAQLRHPNIVSVYNAGFDKSTHYIAMDFVKGRVLSELLQERALTVKDTLAIIRDISLALQCAHEHNIIHRDIKPGNIMIVENGTPVIMDFGLAKDISGSSLSLTQPGRIVGSPQYMSPEQAQGINVDHRSDIFSLGAVFYEMLTYETPFKGKTAVEMVQHVIQVEPLPIRKLAPHVHKDIETICLKCMEKMPAMRYRSAGLIAQDINSFLQGEVIQARPSGKMARLQKWLRRNRLWAIAVLTALGCICVMGMLFFFYQQAERKELQSRSQNRLLQHTQSTAIQLANEIKVLWSQAVKDGHLLAQWPLYQYIMTQDKVSPRTYLQGVNLLKRWAQIKEYSDIFLLKENGCCVISTNEKYVGEDYSFRPYYQRAYQHGEAVYYAIGTTKGIAGYYCGIASHKDNKVVGVCVIKFSTEKISRILRKRTFLESEENFLADENGVLIQSPRQSTDPVSLFPLSEEVSANIKKARQFLDKPVIALPLRFPNGLPDLKKNSLQRVMTEGKGALMMSIVPLQTLPYAVITFISDDEILRLSERF